MYTLTVFPVQHMPGNHNAFGGAGAEGVRQASRTRAGAVGLSVTAPATPLNGHVETTGGISSPQEVEPPPLLPSKRPKMHDFNLSGQNFLKEDIKDVIQQKIYHDPIGRPIRFSHSTGGKRLVAGGTGTAYSYWRCIMHKTGGCPFVVCFTTDDSIRPKWKENKTHSHYEHHDDCELQYQQYVDQLAAQGKKPPKPGPAVTRMVSTRFRAFLCVWSDSLTLLSII